MSLLANQRARKATEIVDASVQFYRAHAITLLTIAAIVIIPTSVIAVFVPEGVRFVISLVENLLFAVGGAAASLYAATVMTEGEITVGEAFRRVSRRIGSVIGAQILFNFAVVGGVLLLVLPGLYFATRLALATTVAAVEKTDSSRSINRSWALTRGHARHAFNTLALCLIIATVVFIGGSLLLGLIVSPLQLGDSVIELMVACLLVVVAPFVWIALTLLYIDVRVRVEGADIAAMVAELPSANPSISQSDNP